MQSKTSFVACPGWTNSWKSKEVWCVGMPSLTEHSYTHMRQPAARYSILVGIMLAACSTLPPTSRNAAPVPPLASTDPCKVADGTPTPQEARILSALRSNVESGPL